MSRIILIRYPEFDGHVTLEQCSGSNGHNFPPLFIFSGVNMTQAFYNHLKLAQSEGRTIPGAKYKMSGDDKGSMNRKIFQFYVEDIFIPNLRDDELPAIRSLFHRRHQAVYRAAPLLTVPHLSAKLIPGLLNPKIYF